MTSDQTGAEGEHKTNKDEKSGRPHNKATDHLPMPVIIRGPPRAWSVSAVRGKVTDRCLWSVCKALTAGVFLIAIGAGMATIGYYSDTLSTVEERRGNTTLLIKNESRDSHLNSLTYLGPIVMGIGGFIIVAACVMTFEARDTTAKIVPVWFRKTRIQVEPGSGSNLSGRSSQTSWERFLVRTRRSKCEDSSRTSMTKAFLNFSKYIQSSIDSGKISPGVVRTHTEKLRKCPSEPSFNIPAPKAKDHIHRGPEAETLLKVNNTRMSLVPPDPVGLRPRPSIQVPHLHRQAMSIDCPRGVVLQRPEGHASIESKTGDNNHPKLHLHLDQTNVNRCDSSGSMALDLYLPQGSVTLKVKDETRKSGVKSSSAAYQISKSSPVGRRRSMSQGTKGSSDFSGLKAKKLDSPRTPPQLSREDSSPKSTPHSTPHLSRESSGQSPKLTPKHTHKSGSKTPRANRENSSSSHKSLPQLCREFSSPTSPHRSSESISPKSRQLSRLSTENSGSDSKINIPSESVAASYESVVQEIIKSNDPAPKRLEKQATDPGFSKKSLKCMSGAQSATIKRHPLLRQKAVDPTATKETVQND